VDKEAESTERRLAFEASDDVVAEVDRLEGGAEHELAGMEDERMGRTRFNLACEVGLHGLRIDQWIPVVLEDAEPVITTNVDARRLNEGAVEGIDGDATGIDGFDDRSIGEDHVR
jgi:hypothetical protein